MAALLRPAFVFMGLFTALLGLAAPLAMTGIAQAVLPGPAGGSLVERDLDLPQRSRLVGTVTAAGSEQPVDQATATLVDAGGTVVAPETDDLGAAVLGSYLSARRNGAFGGWGRDEEW